MNIKQTIKLLILFAIIMDFIPIKIAKKIENIQYKNGTYVCKYITATDGNWMAEKFYNPNIDEPLYFNIEGKADFNMLKDVSKISSGFPILNIYIFQGDVEVREITKNVSFNWLRVEKWDIVYPVKRHSLRDIYVPKTYLTIYDYDWIKILKTIWKSN